MLARSSRFTPPGRRVGLKARGDLTDLHEREPFDRRIALLAAQVPGIASDRVRWSIDLRYQDPAQPTGHPYFSGHVVRSRRNPDSPLTYPEWVTMWEKQLVHDEPWPPVPRWPGSHSV